MKENIIVSKELYKVAIPMEDTNDWGMVHCHKVSIGEFSFVFIPLEAQWGIKLNVTEETSGCKLTEIWVNPFEFAECDTKEKTIELFKNKAEKVVEMIKEIGKEKLKNSITKRTGEIIAMCGPRPESEVVECLM
ncbi:hypothetical protein [Enterococcus caccae]|uniref:Uncharacterized protein n=1 Tax=Enterococcus caccae ATCC BAA-1240 TaxID=1158612 RepID=R3WD06_9ENTE|nr:hypothetical protein [Enterococcus caccae]EOL45781.1 hypothetical protein UC7_01578 [Enterococcus caccae ATCC BAA-1240]EOT60977.1 hypothetical protein I580_01879 [Enterococcus caccae ATCC BAA-1240]OJG27988.1 hypothetical protein RU98_GL002197 [Enterococcus caccae]